MPFEIEPITSAPSSADQAEPRPPNRLVPPMTAAAIAVQQQVAAAGRLVDGEQARRGHDPAERGEVEHSTNTISGRASSGCPARRAASALPPTA